MKKVDVNLKEHSYPIIIEKGFHGLRSRLDDISAGGHKIMIISDTNVAALYIDAFIQELGYDDGVISTYIIKAGESSKSLETVEQLYGFMLKAQVEKSDAILALGGGVVGDLAGFVAATYFRGISFVQVPTTLLAQIDSSVGGKTGVNYQGIKNIIGSFYQPAFVYINMETLKTLPLKEIRNGLAEAVVHGVIASAGMLYEIDQQYQDIMKVDMDCLLPLIYQNCMIKSAFVVQDQYDAGIRNHLNFGHTYGHAIESIYEYRYAHGECVAMGTVAAFKTAVYLNLVSADKLHFITRLLSKIGLETDLSILDWKQITKRLNYDKKKKNEKLMFILPKDFETVIQMEVNLDEALITYLKTKETE